MPPAKDEAEAVNLLSFDGGGVRGVSSLLILHEIMVQIKEACGLERIPKPCEYFHMIAGTSTGGLIAIMLGRLRMSTEEALQEYALCAKNIFSSRNKKWTTATERFRATALKDAVQDLVRRRNMGEYLLDVSLDEDSKGRCFVCVTPAHKVGESRLIRSFFSPDADYHAEVKIWEAARATTAATSYFKPMPIRKRGVSDTEECIDAAIFGCNNPVDRLLAEAPKQFGAGRRLGCLVSIGTGTRLVKIDRPSTGLRNILHVPKFVKQLFGILKSAATDGEEPHYRAQDALGKHTDAYFRFNVPDIADQVGLNEYLKAEILEAKTASYLSQSLVVAAISRVAVVLEHNSADHGLTLGHHNKDKDQLIMATQNARSLGDLSRFFTARDDILGRLDAYFSPRDTGGKPRREFLLHGLGGVGKTQIALKAADGLEKRIPYIFHLDGTTGPTVDQSYANICQRHCPGYDQVAPGAARVTISEMKNVALRWMEGLSDEWLLIYDNLPDNERLKPVLPQRNTGNVIYTSRSRGFLADLPAECVCEVQALSEDDAINLLLRIADREDIRTDEQEMQALRETVAQLGCLPLAIESIGAYLRKGDCTPLTYLQRYRDRRNRAELLSRPNSDGSLPARPELYTAFDLSYEAILSLQRREGDSIVAMAAECALKALNFLCFYHNEAIPIRMIKFSAEERRTLGGDVVYPLSDLADDPLMDATPLLAYNNFEKTWDRTFFDLGVQILQQFSLVTRALERGTISMHVMVQTWAQDRMEKKTRWRQALAARIVLIESIRPNWDRLDQLWMEDLPPHFNACMTHFDAYTADLKACQPPEDATPPHHYKYDGHLDFKLAWYYYQQKDFPTAVDQLLRHLRVAKFNDGSYSQEASLSLTLLGKIYHEMGRINDAQATYLEVLDMLSMRKDDMLDDFQERMALGENEPRGQTRRQKVARLLFPRGSSRSVSGESKNQTAAAQDSHGSGADQSDTIQPVIPTLEQTLRRLSSVDDSDKGSEKETLSDWESSMGMVYASLASLLIDSGRKKLGKQCLQRAIKVAKDAFKYDIQVWTWEDELIRLNGGADLKYWLQRYKAMNALSPELRHQLAGHEYTYVLPIGLAETYIAEGDFEEAYQVYESTFEKVQILYGPSDRKTLYLMRQMAECTVSRGFFDEAEGHARRAVEAAKSAYGQWHCQTAQCLRTLVSIIGAQTLDMGPGSEYYETLQEAYDSIRVAFWEGHPEAKALKNCLERSSSPHSDTGALSEEVLEVRARIFADGVPKSPEEHRTRAIAALQEVRRKRSRVEHKRIRLAEKRRLEQQRDARAESNPATDTTQETHLTVRRITKAEGSRHPKIQEGGGMGSITLAPIPETGPSFSAKPVLAPGPQITIEEPSDDERRVDAKGKRKALQLATPGQLEK